MLRDRRKRIWTCGYPALIGLVTGLTAPVASGAGADTAITGVDLSKYALVGRYDLPEPTRTPALPNTLLAQEASSVTYDWDTNTLVVETSPKCNRSWVRLSMRNGLRQRPDQQGWLTLVRRVAFRWH